MDLFELNGRVVVNLTDALKAFDEIQKEGQKTQSKLSKFFSGVGKGAAVVGKAVGAGMLAAGTAVAGLVTNATSAYAEYEQLVGGVDTLFKESSAKVQAYAEKAYQTAGMSANEYMNTVTSFSASLLQSLGGDTEKAADKADVAIRDMSDNANKMGTSMESIQNAYQGFAKQNYTMLDNLKLGYGGTKEEMQRLLADAEKLSGQKFDISSYADVVDAIHVIQTEMGITGTTAAEASGTITGSMSSVKGAWTNLVTAMASDNLPLDEYITKFADSATTMVSNMMPRIQQALLGVVQLVNQLAPVIIGKIPELLSQLLPSVVEAATGLVNVFVSILPELIQALLDMLPALINGFVQLMDAIIGALPQIVGALIGALPTLLPLLIDGLVTLIVSLCGMLTEIIQPIIDHLPDIIISLVDALMNNLPILITGAIDLILGLVEALPVIIEALVDALPMVIEMIVFGLFEAREALINGSIKLVVAIVTALPRILKSLREALPKAFLGIWNGVKKVFSNVPNWFRERFNTAKTAITNAWSDFKDRFADKWNQVKSVFSNVGGWFKNVFSKAWNGIKSVFSGVKSFFTGVWGKIKDVFSGLGTTISDSISGAVKKGINGLIGGAENIINGFFKMINGAIDMINEIPGVAITKIKLVEFARLAKGGVVDKPTPAIFGEDGAEAVIPLENNTGWINRVAAQLHEFTVKNHGDFGGAFSTRMVELQDQSVSEMRTLNDKVDTIIELLARYFPEMVQAILTDKRFDVNKREFGRLVRETI